MTTLYILVADSSQAKLFRAEKPLKTLEIIFEKDHIQGRQKRSDIDSDRAGVRNSSTKGSHSFAGDKDSHKHEEEMFAKSLCNMLESEYKHRKYDGLILVAPPHFLGFIRQHLSKDCMSVLVKSINKNLVKQTETELIAQLA
jgi:protein required for attachment to host cells